MFCGAGGAAFNHCSGTRDVTLSRERARTEDDLNLSGRRFRVGLTVLDKVVKARSNETVDEQRRYAGSVIFPDNNTDTLAFKVAIKDGVADLSSVSWLETGHAVKDEYAKLSAEIQVFEKWRRLLSDNVDRWAKVGLMFVNGAYWVDMGMVTKDIGDEFGMVHRSENWVKLPCDIENMALRGTGSRVTSDHLHVVGGVVRGSLGAFSTRPICLRDGECS